MIFYFECKKILISALETFIPLLPGCAKHSLVLGHTQRNCVTDEQRRQLFSLNEALAAQDLIRDTCCPTNNTDLILVTLQTAHDLICTLAAMETTQD